MSAAGPPPLPPAGAEVARILERFIRDETAKFGFHRAVVGLSGGLDSAVTLALGARALGPENLLAVILPYRSSHPSSRDDAEAMAGHAGVTARVVEITPMVDAYFQIYPEAGRLRRGNKMARERMSILYDLSEEWRGLVLGTSNKTELLLGYGTLHGDMASAVNPIGDLYKTQVRTVAPHLGVIPEILAKTPSADLWEGQSDEEELGYTYAEVDRLLYLMVDLRYERESLLAAGFAAGFVDRVAATVRGSQFKRLPPVIAKVSPRTIGRDFRYPRDWGK